MSCNLCIALIDLVVVGADCEIASTWSVSHARIRGLMGLGMPMLFTKLLTKRTPR